MHRHEGTHSPTAIEPAALTEREASAFLSISPRLLRQLIDRGDIKPIRVPGVRRILFDVAELRALLAKWKTATTTPDRAA